MEKPVQVAVVGAGPAGCYAVDYLLKHGPTGSRIHVFERLPNPHGLVRSGVAPDHPEVKSVENKFEEVLASPQVEYFGHVTVGDMLGDVPLAALRAYYDAVIMAYGCDMDKQLGLEGESTTRGVQSARDFVGWYNGHPDYQANSFFDRDEAFSHSDVVVVGHGNVALDVARILAKPVDELRKTDITQNALDRLAASQIQRIHVVGRRGLLQASFTTKELRELHRLPSVNLTVHRPKDVHTSNLDATVLSSDRARRRMSDLVTKVISSQEKDDADEAASTAQRTISLRFFSSPVALHADSDHRLLSVDLQRNGLDDSGAVVPTDEVESLPCGLLLRSIGYKAIRVDSKQPFDSARGVMPNVHGRVDGAPGLYVAGWLKTGPTGVIASTLNNAYETAACLLHDVAHGDLESGKIETSPWQTREQVDQWLCARSRNTVVSHDDWTCIDDYERVQGQERGAPREKLTRVQSMLDVLASR